MDLFFVPTEVLYEASVGIKVLLIALTVVSAGLTLGAVFELLEWFLKPSYNGGENSFHYDLVMLLIVGVVCFFTFIPLLLITFYFWGWTFFYLGLFSL